MRRLPPARTGESTCAQHAIGVVPVSTVDCMTLPIPLSTALASADELAWMLERIDLGTLEAVWVVWQAEMLAHWASVIDRECPCYPALAAGLAEFATQTIERARDAQG